MSSQVNQGNDQEIYCKPILTPMVTGFKLSIDDSSKDVDQRLYRSMIGSLLYVTTSQPYVMQAVGQVARFQAAPKESHIITIKRILRYLKGTTDMACGITRVTISLFIHLQMNVGKEVLMIVRVLMKHWNIFARSFGFSQVLIRFFLFRI